MNQTEVASEAEIENENVNVNNVNEHEMENANEHDELMPTSSPQPSDNPIGVSSVPVAKKMTRKRRRKELKAIREIDFASSSDAEVFPSKKVQRRLNLWRAHFSTSKKKPRRGQVSSSSNLSEESEDTYTMMKPSKCMQQIAVILERRTDKSPHSWLGKEVIYEMDKIQDERIKRKATCAIQNVLKQSIEDDLALRNGLIRSSPLSSTPSTSRHSPQE